MDHIPGKILVRPLIRQRALPPYYLALPQEKIRAPKLRHGQIFLDSAELPEEISEAATVKD